MFRKKNKIEVVPESDYTDFSHRFEETERTKYATKETYITAALVPITGVLGYKAFFSNSTPSVTPTPTIPEAITVSAQPQIIEPTEFIAPVSQLAQTPIVLNDPNMIPVSVIGDASLNALTTILNPVLDLLVAISFPIASVMILGACFFLMFGKDDRAMSMMMKTALGYCLIQLSPMLLGILKTLGDSVAPQ